jgi:NADPH:quinone reductase-like Zn-dependent oxidoreductase
MYAIKLASLAGYKVVTVASKHNWNLVKSLGASEVFDYKNPEVVACIKEWVKNQGSGPLTKAVDTISENGSIEKAIEILDKQGDLVTLSKSSSYLRVSSLTGSTTE